MSPITISPGAYLYIIEHVACMVEEARSFGHDMAPARWEVVPGRGIRLIASCQARQCCTMASVWRYDQMGLVGHDNGLHAPCPMPVPPTEEG